jgi:hypothetical protein
MSRGNVRTDSLGAVYRDDAVFRALRTPDALHGKCGVCEFRAICGGSRSRAFATTGDVMASDPLCAYESGRLPAAAGFPAPPRETGRFVPVLNQHTACSEADSGGNRSGYPMDHR